MSEDIVARLRELACISGHGELGDAADEIERLRADLDYWKKDSAAAWDKCEERRAERDALRALLRDRMRFSDEEIDAALNKGAGDENT